MLTKDIPQVLSSMYELRREMVPCFIGAPGIGKTQGIYEFAKSKGVKVVTFILSNTVPSEVSGIRMPDNETKTLVTFDDARMASLEDGDILFFDEILEAPPMLWSSILTLIQDRVMASGRELPDVMIVAASNPVAAPSVIPPSVRDRFMWCELGFDFDSWRNWFRRKYGKIVPERVRYAIKTDSAYYNILTPRRFTKLFEYLQADSENGKIISSMFGGEILELLIDTLDSSDEGTPFQVVRELKLAGIDVPESWENLSMKQIMQEIQKLDDAEAIMQALQNVEVKDNA